MYYRLSIPVFLSPGVERRACSSRRDARLHAAAMQSGQRGAKWLDLPNVSHGFAGYDSADAAVDWIAARFAGRANPSNC